MFESVDVLKHVGVLWLVYWVMPECWFKHGEVLWWGNGFACEGITRNAAEGLDLCI